MSFYSSPFASFRTKFKGTDQTHPAVNSLHTTLFTLADRRHVRPESLIPTDCEREIESKSERRRRRCLADISPVCQNERAVRDSSVSSRRRRHEIGGTRGCGIDDPGA